MPPWLDGLMDGVSKSCIDLVGPLCLDDVVDCVCDAITDLDRLPRLNSLLEGCGLVLSAGWGVSVCWGLSVCLLGSISSRWGLFSIKKAISLHPHGLL